MVPTLVENSNFFQVLVLKALSHTSLQAKVNNFTSISNRKIPQPLLYITQHELHN